MPLQTSHPRVQQIRITWMSGIELADINNDTQETEHHVKVSFVILVGVMILNFEFLLRPVRQVQGNMIPLITTRSIQYL